MEESLEFFYEILNLISVLNYVKNCLSIFNRYIIYRYILFDLSIF